jgi:hypothetical protein
MRICLALIGDQLAQPSERDRIAGELVEQGARQVAHDAGGSLN